MKKCNKKFFLYAGVFFCSNIYFSVNAWSFGLDGLKNLALGNIKTQFAKKFINIYKDISKENITNIDTGHSIAWNAFGCLVDCAKKNKHEINIFRQDCQMIKPYLSLIDTTMVPLLDRFTQWSEKNLEDFSDKVRNCSAFENDFSYEKCVGTLGQNFDVPCSRFAETYDAFKQNPNFFRKVFYAEQNNRF